MSKAMKLARLATVLGAVLSTATALGAAEKPVVVSPVAVDGADALVETCPTFHWGGASSSKEYELRVYRVVSRATEAGAALLPVVHLRLPESSRGWTPALDRCFEPGQSYAWTIGSIDDSGETAWSESSLFRVSTAPSVAEVEEALEVLRRYRTESLVVEGQEQEESFLRRSAAESQVSVGLDRAAGGSALKAQTGTDSSGRQNDRAEWRRAGVERREGAPLSSQRSGPTSERAPTIPSNPVLTLDGSLFFSPGSGGVLSLGETGNIFKEGQAWAWDDSIGNTAFGADALASTTIGGMNTAFGSESLGQNTEGEYNTAVGYRSLVYNQGGSSNTAVGMAALGLNTSGESNVAIGDSALYSNDTGAYNIAIGNASLEYADASNNLAIGFRALAATSSGDRNVAIGNEALMTNSTGGVNTAVGYRALYKSNAQNGTAVGFYALGKNTSGQSNTAVGSNALKANTTGESNVAVGQVTLYTNISGDHNTAVGWQALRRAGAATENTVVGAAALYGKAYGNPPVFATANTAVGFRSMHYCCTNETFSKGNVAVGWKALENTTQGNKNIAVGYKAGSTGTNGDNNIFIGNYGGNESNTIRLGTQGSHQKAYVAGVYGTTGSGSNYVHVTSSGQLVQGNSVPLSSRRFKNDIRDIGIVSDKVLELRPVSFRFKEDVAGADPGLQFGLIAEEVAEVFPELVAYDDEGRPRTVKYRLLSSLLLNELKEQKGRIERLDRRRVSSQAWLLAMLLLAAIVATSYRP